MTKTRPRDGRIFVGAVLVMILASCVSSGPSAPAAVDVVVATVTIAGEPLAVVFGPDQAPWVVTGSGGSITRVDPSSNSPGQPIVVPTGIAAASGGGALWIGSGGGTLSRVDPVSGSLVASVPTGSQANAVDVAFGSVWTTDYLANTLLRIDPSSNQVVARIGVGGLPIAIVAGGGSLWVLSATDGSIARVDPASNQIVGTVPPEADRNDLVFLDEKLYIVGGSDSGAGYIERIEPTNLQIVTRGALTGPGYHVAGADAALWVSLSSGKSVAKVDPLTLLTTASVPTAGEPQGLAVGHQAVWVAVDNPDGLVRIATGH